MANKVFGLDLSPINALNLDYIIKHVDPQTWKTFGKRNICDGSRLQTHERMEEMRKYMQYSTQTLSGLLEKGSSSSKASEKETDLETTYKELHTVGMEVLKILDNLNPDASDSVESDLEAGNNRKLNVNPNLVTKEEIKSAIDTIFEELRQNYLRGPASLTLDRVRPLQLFMEHYESHEGNIIYSDVEMINPVHLISNPTASYASQRFWTWMREELIPKYEINQSLFEPLAVCAICPLMAESKFTKSPLMILAGYSPIAFTENREGLLMFSVAHKTKKFYMEILKILLESKLEELVKSAKVDLLSCHVSPSIVSAAEELDTFVSNKARGGYPPTIGDWKKLNEIIPPKPINGCVYIQTANNFFSIMDEFWKMPLLLEHRYTLLQVNSMSFNISDAFPKQFYHELLKIAQDSSDMHFEWLFTALFKWYKNVNFMFKVCGKNMIELNPGPFKEGLKYMATQFILPTRKINASVWFGNSHNPLYHSYDVCPPLMIKAITEVVKEEIADLGNKEPYIIEINGNDEDKIDPPISFIMPLWEALEKIPGVSVQGDLIPLREDSPDIIDKYLTTSKILD